MIFFVNLLKKCAQILTPHTVFMIIYEHSKYTKQGESFILKFFTYIDLISYISFMYMPLIFDIPVLVNYAK